VYTVDGPRWQFPHAKRTILLSIPIDVSVSVASASSTEATIVVPRDVFTDDEFDLVPRSQLVRIAEILGVMEEDVSTATAADIAIPTANATKTTAATVTTIGRGPCDEAEPVEQRADVPPLDVHFVVVVVCSAPPPPRSYTLLMLFLLLPFAPSPSPPALYLRMPLLVRPTGLLRRLRLLLLLPLRLPLQDPRLRYERRRRRRRRDRPLPAIGGGALRRLTLPVPGLRIGLGTGLGRLPPRPTPVPLLPPPLHLHPPRD
jgi:hypothetical protein